MDMQKRLIELRAELASLAGRIETVRAEIEPRPFEQRKQELEHVGAWAGIDSVGWLLLFVDGSC
jgi:hypothetical protein